MNQEEAIQKMVPPGQPRKGKWREGVMQIHVTRACDKACINCTQGSNFSGPTTMIPLDKFEQAVKSLQGYFGVVGVFGGNPALHPQFSDLCQIMRDYVPFHQRGIWCNNPINETKGREMAKTFDPKVSNLNVHLDKVAYDNFKLWWPACKPVGLEQDSRHSPIYGFHSDLGVSEEESWEAISDCDINQNWSAMIGMFGDELRGYFCEVAGGMAMYLKANGHDVPDLGLPVIPGWWKRPMQDFAEQVKFHCKQCLVPFRGYGDLACNKEGHETITESWSDKLKTKRVTREVQIAVSLEDLQAQSLKKTTDYLGNASR